MPFSIIAKSGDRYDYTEPNLSWQYGLVPGSSQVEDRSIVEVLQEADDEIEVITRYTDVAAVGELPGASIICAEGAQLLALLFNSMTCEQKINVDKNDAKRISNFMVHNGYRFVSDRWYRQANPSILGEQGDW